MSNDTAPDLIGPVVAYRAWRVQDDFLRSMAWWGIDYPPNTEMHARCIGLRSLGCDAPGPACRCGIYVMHTLDDLLAEPTQIAAIKRTSGWRYGVAAQPAIAGEVEVWGRSERYKRGRRVEWCRIRSLYAEPLEGTVDVGEVAERYGVPLLDDPEGKIAAWKAEPPPNPQRFTTVRYSGQRFSSGGYIPSGPQYSAHVDRQGTVTHHAVPVRLYTTGLKDYAEAMRQAVQSMANAYRVPMDVMDPEQDTPTDPDKPIPGPPKDHLRIADRHRTRGARP